MNPATVPVNPAFKSDSFSNTPKKGYNFKTPNSAKGVLSKEKMIHISHLIIDTFFTVSFKVHADVKETF